MVYSSRLGADVQPHRANPLQKLSVKRFNSTFNWTPKNLDRLEYGLFTRVTLAAGIGNVDLLTDLIARGASLAIKSDGGYSPLHAAVTCQQLGAAMCLLGAAGSRLAQSRTTGGLTPLMLACSASMPLKFAQVLLPYSPVAARDDAGLRAQDHARIAGRDDIVAWLTQQNCPSSQPAEAVAKPHPVPGHARLLATLARVVCDLPAWRERIVWPELSSMHNAWKALVLAHRRVGAHDSMGDVACDTAVEQMTTLLAQIMQRQAPTAVERSMMLHSDTAVAQLQRRAMAEGDHLSAVVGSADPAQIDSDLTSLAVRLVPMHVILLIIEKRLARGTITPQRAERELTRAQLRAVVMIAQSDMEKPRGAAVDICDSPAQSDVLCRAIGKISTFDEGI